jgi:hypothetical protein
MANLQAILQANFQSIAQALVLMLPRKVLLMLLTPFLQEFVPNHSLNHSQTNHEATFVRG